MTEQLFKYMLFRIRERAQEAAQESDAEPEDLFRQGRRLAYYEVLDMLRSELDAHEADVAGLGLEDIETLLENSVN